MTPLPASDIPPVRGFSPEAPPPGIVLRGVRLTYDGTALFDSLDLDLPAGLCTCLLGASGCGKSSLLRLIAGLLPTAAGSVAGSDGEPLSGRVAFMAQQDLLLPWLSALENAVLGARLRGQAPPVARAAELLGSFGLGDRLRARPAALSGGMRQRVALARTLVEERPVVLMDEPFSALDAITRFRMQTLAAAALRGRTVLLVTHDPLEALRLGDRVLVLGGRPARVVASLAPPGPPPRDATDAPLLHLQGELLERLAAESP